LIIRDHIEADIEGMHLLLSNEKVMYYLPDIKTDTLEESKNNLKVAIEEAANQVRTKYFFAIIMKATKEYIGEVGFTVITACPKGRIVNLGYFILERFWGKGITKEAAGEVANYAFSIEGIIKIETGCVKENIASEMVMKKIGMLKEAELKKHEFVQGELRDRLEYGLLKEEWEKQKGILF